MAVGSSAADGSPAIMPSVKVAHSSVSRKREARCDLLVIGAVGANTRTQGGAVGQIVIEPRLPVAHELQIAVLGESGHENVTLRPETGV